MPSRSDNVQTVHQELTDFARRARAETSILLPDLPLVAYTLLGHVRATGGCRASDLVAFYGLEKSTISRQIADLEGHGLIERIPDSRDGRVHMLQLTDAGSARLASADREMHTAFEERLADWSDVDVAQFAQLLARYNRSRGPRNPA